MKWHQWSGISDVVEAYSHVVDSSRNLIEQLETGEVVAATVCATTSPVLSHCVAQLNSRFNGVGVTYVCRYFTATTPLVYTSFLVRDMLSSVLSAVSVCT